MKSKQKAVNARPPAREARWQAADRGKYQREEVYVVLSEMLLKRLKACESVARAGGPGHE